MFVYQPNLCTTTAQQTQGIDPLWIQFWASVAGIGPTSSQYWFDILCFLSDHTDQGGS